MKPERDIHDQADGTLRAMACENLAFRITNGKHKNGIYELLESELNGEPTFRHLLCALTDLLLDESGERDTMADKIVQGLIERYLDAHPDLVEEEALEIENDR